MEGWCSHQGSRKHVGGEDKVGVHISFKEFCVKCSQEWNWRDIKKEDIIS